MIPIHTNVNLNAALAQAGFQITPDDTTEVGAYTSGSNAHIYVNVKGRRPDGVVTQDMLNDTVERLVAICKDLRDPVTGDPVFEVVLRGSELDKVHLNHPGRAGEVWVNARPGYQLRSRIDPKAPVFESNRVGGQHGFLGSNREIQAIFYAIGPAVPKTSLGHVQHVDVAPTAAALLGIEPPKDNQGRAVLEPVR
jgi:predicted AlkP superfamily phosphohydrolase/phosphomutase